MRTLKRPSPFDSFCEDYLDGLYDSRLSYNNQCSGYYKLKSMVKNGIRPATKEEYHRWKTKPTEEELFGYINDKYLTFLHEILRGFVIEYWDYIVKLRVD